MNKKTVNLIFAKLRDLNPQPKTELRFSSTFELLVAVLLSAQATDVSVNKATEVLFAKANTPEAMLALGEEMVKTYIKSIGLYQSKAKHLIKTCALLVTQFKSEVPSTLEALESLPGVGRKTANVVLNTAFGLPTLAVDTHIFRVANRTGMGKGTTPLAVEKALLKRINPEFLQYAHHWLILHGRYVCLARKPRCADCVIKDLCEYKHKS